MSGKLLGLCGSLRKASFNRMLLKEAARLYAPGSYAEGDLNLPLYDGDLEEASGVPAAVQALADQIAEAEAVIIACPEYNQSLTGVLKNALDWISRTKGGVWGGKPVAIIGAAAGRTGGARAQYALRLCMTPFRAHVLAGPEVLVANPAAQFSEAGELETESYVKALTALIVDLKSAAQA